MAEKIVSPGVFTKENDLSFLQQGVADIGTAFVGPFKEGPLVPKIVNTQTEFEQLYGITDDTYYTPLAVQAYLKEAGAATICRVAGIGGYKEENPLLITYQSASVTSSVAVLFNTDIQTASFTTDIVLSNNSGSIGQFTLSSSQLGTLTAVLDPENPDDVESVYGMSPRGSKQAYAYAYFSEAAAGLTYISSSVSITTLPDQEFKFDACEAKTPYIQSQLISGQRYNMFRFETIAGGNAANTKIKIGITNIKPAGTVPGTDYATFTVVIRAFGDTNKKKSAIESYSNLTLDPNSPNNIYRVIGDRHITIGDDGKVTETGDWVNKSNYIRMVSVDRDPSLAPELIPVTCTPWGHDAYQLPLSASAAIVSTIPAVTYTAASATTYGGIDLDSNTDNQFFLRAIPFPEAPSTGSNLGYYLDTDGLQPTGTLAADVVKRNFLVAFQEGFDGMSPTIPINKGKDITATNTQGLNCASSTASGSIAYGKMISALSNADEYDIQMIVTPGIVRKLHPAVVEDVINMVQEIRGDAFYIFEGTEALGSIAEAKDQAQQVDSNYAAMYYPWVKTIDVNTNKLITIPPSVLLPAVYAANDRVAAEWFAPAGLNRGGLGGAVAVMNKLTQADRDSLYEDKVNPIVQFPGQGIVAFGQKTLQTKPSALDRINVRRLLLTVRKYIASTSRYLVFEQNSSTTRNRFLSIVNPYLEGIQQRQGLYAFKVIMDDSNNTPDVIDRNFLKGAIYLQPTKTAEFIQIDFNILPTGAAFGG
jgi:hypothetical protein